MPFPITNKNTSPFLIIMPVNLPVEALKAQREYEEAKYPGERLKKGEAFLKAIPKHKGTANMRAQIKTTLSKIREELDKSKKKQAKRQSIFVKKHGAAQICIVGFPNTGKSYLLNNLTNIKIDSTNVPFETAMPEVAMANFEDVQFQMVEIPSIIEDFREFIFNAVSNSFSSGFRYHTLPFLSFPLRTLPLIVMVILVLSQR